MKMKFAVIVLIVSCTLVAQDMKRNAAASLFSDFKANRLGDAITIYVMESSQASNQAETKSGRSSGINFGSSLEVGKTPIPNNSLALNSGNSFNGSGGTKSYGVVTTKISATIDSVLSNGNIRIRGSRKIVINGEEQIVHIKGVVRTTDISSENVVYSYNITEAEIIFEGQGMIDSAQKPGMVTKLFHWLF
ncbi:MAG: flagellar basal body L-ring protein FlgH [Ignavibacteriales bacterium]|nr:flagellar basal body L-ring protein FlgH [Ignavibacteriales bacterium]